jgi:ribosomal protein S18 acetylase RimI-like enzyme
MPGDGGVFWLDWIIIDKLYRGRGIATAFIPIVLKELRRKGAHAVWLDSRTNNTASIKLFKNNNFHKVKMRKWFFEQDYYIWFKQI